MPYVTPADINDRTALQEMITFLKDRCPYLSKMWADLGYQGQKLKAEVADKGIDLEIVRRPPKRFWVPNHIKDVGAYLKSIGVDITEGFKVLPRRWVVEGTFAWMGRYRRMSKDYEFLCHTQETMMMLAMTRIMLKRMAKLNRDIIQI